MKTVSEIINAIMQKMKNTNGYRKIWLEEHWNELAGITANKHSKPQRMDNEVLYVKVDSSVWNYNLFMNKVNLINSINQKFGQVIVKDIKYNMGEIEKEHATEHENIYDLCENTNADKDRLNTYLSDKKLIEFLRKKN